MAFSPETMVVAHKAMGSVGPHCESFYLCARSKRSRRKKVGLSLLLAFGAMATTYGDLNTCVDGANARKGLEDD